MLVNRYGDTSGLIVSLLCWGQISGGYISGSGPGTGLGLGVLVGAIVGAVGVAGAG